MTRRRGNPTVQCHVCRHADRGRIELALVSGASAYAIGRKFGVSRHALGRHLKAHVTQERRAQLVAGPVKLSQLAERAAEEGMSVLEYLGMIRSLLTHQLLTASEVGDADRVEGTSDKLMRCLGMLAQLSGELTHAAATVTNNTVNVFMNDPAYLQFQADLVRVLSKHPAAYADVLAEFERLDAATSARHAPALEHHAQPA